MDRLTRYLQGQFFAQALTIFAAGGTLIWLMQLLRLFDLISDQGQSFLTLMGQSLLTTPTYARSILYVCFAIGLARALQALQASRELHTIHAAQRTGALWRAVLIFTLIGATAVSLVSNWVEPHARRVSADWSAEIAADIVSRALAPGRFTEIQSGLVVSITGRQRDGTLVGFFFDDTTTDTRRSYFARTASVLQDANGYQLILNDGAIQYENPEREGLSQIRFAQYHISLESLLEATVPTGGFEQTDSFALIAKWRDGEASERERRALHERFADGLRAFAMIAFATALCAFPSGSRGRRQVPVELVILLVAFGEQAVSAFSGGGVGHYYTAGALLALSLMAIVLRANRAFVLPRPRRAAS